MRGLPAKANTVRWKAHRIFREVEFVAVKQTRIAFIIGQTVIDPLISYLFMIMSSSSLGSRSSKINLNIYQA